AYLKSEVGFVSLSRRLYGVGSRTDNRDTFLCLSKEKYPKEKTPGGRCILRADDFAEGFRKGYH
ncbi:MAG: hypothetical protein KJ725_10750, partial [Gammaproteobacteria bacterium]|nr:hypothetical protein [Gammaproteobacteria bacterium]